MRMVWIVAGGSALLYFALGLAVMAGIFPGFEPGKIAPATESTVAFTSNASAVHRVAAPSAAQIAHGQSLYAAKCSVYARSAWGNHGCPVTSARVAAVRARW